MQQCKRVHVLDPKRRLLRIYEWMYVCCIGFGAHDIGATHAHARCTCMMIHSILLPSDLNAEESIHRFLLTYVPAVPSVAVRAVHDDLTLWGTGR